MADPQTTAERDHFAFTPEVRNWYENGELEAVAGEQGVTISVTQEQAVDSYNSSLTCEAVLPRSDAERLRDWLIKVLS